ncbi:unnamed protein product, partial [Mesorhabditis spiculigera]
MARKRKSKDTPKKAAPKKARLEGDGDSSKDDGAGNEEMSIEPLENAGSQRLDGDVAKEKKSETLDVAQSRTSDPPSRPVSPEPGCSKTAITHKNMKPARGRKKGPTVQIPMEAKDFPNMTISDYLKIARRVQDPKQLDRPQALRDMVDDALAKSKEQAATDQGSGDKPDSEDGEELELSFQPYGDLSDITTDEDDSEAWRPPTVNRGPRKNNGNQEIEEAYPESGDIPYTMLRVAAQELPILPFAREHDIDLDLDKWSNEELEALLGGVKAYGADELASRSIPTRFVRGRDDKEVFAKINEIRKLYVMATEKREKIEEENWQMMPKGRRGYDWRGFLSRMMKMNISTKNFEKDNFCDKTLEEILQETAGRVDDEPKVYKATDHPEKLGPHSIHNGTISWRKLYQYVANSAATVGSEETGITFGDPLNPLEASVFLHVVDGMRDAAVNMSPEQAMHMNGIFDSFKWTFGSRRFFPCSKPPTLETVQHLLVDPLNLDKIGQGSRKDDEQQANGNSSDRTGSAEAELDDDEELEEAAGQLEQALFTMPSGTVKSEVMSEQRSSQ